MNTSSIAALCLLAVTQASQASDMAIVDAVTGNQQQPMSSTQRASPSAPSPSGRTAPQKISKFDYTAREKAREMKCEDSRDPAIEPSTTGGEILVFRCSDGRELRLRCSMGLGCVPQQ